MINLDEVEETLTRQGYIGGSIASKLLELARKAVMPAGQWFLCGEVMPPPHDVYEVWRNGTHFQATPCYGMHVPWWVPRNGYTAQESEPINVESADRRRRLSPPA